MYYDTNLLISDFCGFTEKFVSPIIKITKHSFMYKNNLLHEKQTGEPAPQLDLI